MARYSIHPDSFGDYNRLLTIVTDRCPSALFDSDELIDDIHAKFWVSDDEDEVAAEVLKELGCEYRTD